MSTRLSEIVEERSDTVSLLPEITEEDYVYVAVGKGTTSSDTLAWALENLVQPGTTVFLVHVYPEVRSIPTPLGMLPKSQVSPSQIESHMLQVRHATRELLLPFINMCHSAKVNVETILIESDSVVKAIIGLIPVLQIRKLVVGSTKSSLRRSRRGSGGKAVQIRDWATESCELKIICERREISTADRAPPSPKAPQLETPAVDKVPSSPQAPPASLSPLQPIEENLQDPALENDPHCTTCICFRGRF